MTAEHIRILILVILTTIFQIYASVCLFWSTDRKERLMSMAVFLLGAIVFQLVNP